VGLANARLSSARMASYGDTEVNLGAGPGRTLKRLLQLAFQASHLLQLGDVQVLEVYRSLKFVMCMVSSILRRDSAQRLPAHVSGELPFLAGPCNPSALFAFIAKGPENAWRRATTRGLAEALSSGQTSSPNV